MAPMADDWPALDESLRGLGDLYARYQRLGQLGPAPKSLASRDGRAELGQYAWVLAASAMSSAIDHLISGTSYASGSIRRTAT